MSLLKTWAELGVQPPSRHSHPKESPREAWRLEEIRLKSAVASMAEAGTLPALNQRQRYSVGLDGVAVHGN